jgi:hypothetical protein
MLGYNVLLSKFQLDSNTDLVGRFTVFRRVRFTVAVDQYIDPNELFKYHADQNTPQGETD